MNWRGVQFSDMAQRELVVLRANLAAEVADIKGDGDLPAARKRQLEQAIAEIDLVVKP